jgi:TPR repeat protein
MFQTIILCLSFGFGFAIYKVYELLDKRLTLLTRLVRADLVMKDPVLPVDTSQAAAASELRKHRWAIQMLVYKIFYKSDVDLHKVFLDDFLHNGHSVRTYTETFIYPEVVVDPQTQHDLGYDYMYGTGRAFEKDTVQAKYWLSKSAAAGHAGAAMLLRRV